MQDLHAFHTVLISLLGCILSCFAAGCHSWVHLNWIYFSFAYNISLFLFLQTRFSNLLSMEHVVGIPYHSFPCFPTYCPAQLHIALLNCILLCFDLRWISFSLPIGGNYVSFPTEQVFKSSVVHVTDILYHLISFPAYLHIVLHIKYLK